MLRPLLITILMFGSGAIAADRYVSTTGNAGNPGTIASPWTLAKAFSNTGAVAGDVVYVRGGTYSGTYSVANSGTLTQPIVFRNYEGETPVIDNTSLVPTSGNSSAVRVSGRSHVTIQGFTIRNLRTTDETVVPAGIEVRGTCAGVRLLNNIIHHIEQNNGTLNSFTPNGHGIKVYGTNSGGVSNLVIDGNQLYSLKLGASEALVVNGNVFNFRITNNVVHDCDNIGIDMIGFEGTGPSGVDRARNGVCAGNVVYNIDSSINPAYGGSPTSGGGQRAAAGIYVDGGSNIVIERNLVHSCNYGVEIASEADFGIGVADLITLRNNIIRHNHQSGLIMGGYNSSRGSTTNCTIANNTIYENGTLAATVQIFGQHHISGCVFKNNIVVAPSSTRLVFGIYPNSAITSFSSNAFRYNLYYSPAGAPVFDLQSNESLAQWQADSLSGGDTGSTVGEPQFGDSRPTTASPVTGYQLSGGSPAVNTGEPSPAYAPGGGELDFAGNARLKDGRVDRGAFEH